MQPAAKPTRVGPYKLGKTLGIGSFCKVKLAVHELTGQKVAIKILNRKKLKAMDMGEKVRTEIHILRIFTHPHIIRLYEVIDTPNDIYSVMEYVPGGELFDYIVSRGKLDEKEARSLIQQIVSGVDYCHVHMVVHRDLKPENLLLDADNKIKIADFGLSSRMKDGQLLKTSCGSPNYAAPEVISGNLYAGPEVDVWSIGVIMYAILCGSLPFDDENIRNLFRKIKGGIYTIPSYVSAPARDLLHKMLVVDPLKRITIPQIMQHPWYRQSLPAYLALSAEQQIERTQAIDEATLQKVVQMGFHRDRVIRALSLGAELLTSRKMAHLTDARYVAVVYNLMLDQKRKKERAGEENKLADTAETKLASDAIIVYNANTPDPSSTIMDPTMSAIAMSTYKAVDALHVQEQNRSLSHPPRWHLGSFCRDDPQTIMNAVYRALKHLNFEWKVLSLYKLKCRFPSGLSSPTTTSPPISSSDVCKIGIQLYKTPRNVHILDISKLYGQMFLFLDLCGQLQMELSSTVLIRS